MLSACHGFAPRGKFSLSPVCAGKRDTVRWELSESGTLTISGKGAMEDYYSQSDLLGQVYKDKASRLCGR